MDYSMEGLVPPPEPPLSKFKVVGIRQNCNFQRAKFCVEKLHEYLPKIFDKPEIRAMCSLDWELYLIKMKRRFGGGFWVHTLPVVVYLDGNYVGTDQELYKNVSECYNFEVDVNFNEMGENDLCEYFESVTLNDKRKFAYITVAFDKTVLGSMLFLLYYDLVPHTCENFLERCKNGDYVGTKIHRVARPGWIQCGEGVKDIYNMPCENYAVGHDKRGVLSMCNSKRHRHNTGQFSIALDPTPWMEYRYVAFGQLIEGENILKRIEQLTTYYQMPLQGIFITDCGEFNVYKKPSSIELIKPFAGSFPSLDLNLADDKTLSNICVNYKEGKYGLITDALTPYGSGVVISIKHVPKTKDTKSIRTL